MCHICRDSIVFILPAHACVTAVVTVYYSKYNACVTGSVTVTKLTVAGAYPNVAASYLHGEFPMPSATYTINNICCIITSFCSKCNLIRLLKLHAIEE